MYIINGIQIDRRVERALAFISRGKNIGLIFLIIGIASLRSVGGAFEIPLYGLYMLLVVGAIIVLAILDFTQPTPKLLLATLIVYVSTIPVSLLVFILTFDIVSLFSIIIRVTIFGLCLPVYLQMKDVVVTKDDIQKYNAMQNYCKNYNGQMISIKLPNMLSGNNLSCIFFEDSIILTNRKLEIYVSSRYDFRIIESTENNGASIVAGKMLINGEERKFKMDRPAYDYLKGWLFH